MDITITLPEKLSFTSGDTTYDVPSDTIPAESVVRLLMYGRRMFNDSVNGAIHAEKDKATGEQRGRAAIADDWLAKLADGTLGTGGGGGASRLSDLEKELRATVQGMLVSACGYKAGEATKLVSKGASHAFETIVTELGSDDEKASDAWEKLLVHAEKIVAERKAGPSIDDLLS